MNELNGYSFTKKEVENLDYLADSIYNIVVIVDYYCSTQRQIEELYNLTPVIQNLRRLADELNSIFINLEDNNE